MYYSLEHAVCCLCHALLIYYPIGVYVHTWLCVHDTVLVKIVFIYLYRIISQ